MTSRLKKIILIIVIIATAYFAYELFWGDSEDGGTLISGTNSLNTRNTADTQILGQQITQALIQIESLRLDRGIFNNPIYESLIDRSEPILSEPIGRTNPFAPLSDTSVNVDDDSNEVSPTPSDENSPSEEMLEPEEDLPASGI